MATVRLATKDEIADWNAHLLDNPGGGEFFHTTAFAKIKTNSRWQSVFLYVDGVYVLVLEAKLGLLGKLWYIPMGLPLAPDKATLTHLKQLARSHHVFAIKTEFALEASAQTRTQLEKSGFDRATDVQPTTSTIWVDLKDKDEKALLESFDGKTRYNIRQAQKSPITCKEVAIDDESCRKFYDLLTETAADRFGIRPFEYYAKFWQSFAAIDQGKFFFAFDEDDNLLSADFIMLLGNKASRKDAASLRQKTVRGAPALLELYVMTTLQQAGVTAYDLCGSPSSDQLHNQENPLYGIGKFKSGFSDKVTDYIGTYQLPIAPLRSMLWTKFVERLVRKLFYMRHGQAFY